jgi:hypothetical protein
MRTSTAYFAGVGTVFVAVAAGLGGGYLAANVVSPPTQAISKLERSVADRKAVAEPIPVKAAAEPTPNIATEVKTPPSAAAAEQPQTPLPPSAQIEAAAPPSAPRVEEKTVTNTVAVDPPAPPVAATSKPVESKAVEKAEQKTTGPRETFARASDADIKRTASERRRAERRQPPAERRQPPPRDELDVVEERVREATEPRRIRVREESEPRQFAEPTRSAAPRIRLFDVDE